MSLKEDCWRQAWATLNFHEFESELHLYNEHVLYFPRSYIFMANLFSSKTDLERINDFSYLIRFKYNCLSVKKKNV